MPQAAKKMALSLSSFVRRGTSFLTPSASTTDLTSTHGTFTKAPEGSLFPKVDPAIDGEDCEHDCESCTIHYPAKFSIEEDDKLYGKVNGWATHMIVATGKTDWVRDVQDEKGSVMEAVRDCGVQPNNGKLMLSASNIPLPEKATSATATTVLLLPSFTIIENVTPASVAELITHYISPSPTNTTPLSPNPQVPSVPSSSSPSIPQTPTPPLPVSETFTTRPCPHKALILICSQKTRDARCGQSAPLLRRELERHLRPLGLYRDLHDTRPGGVGIYFISHVGGHKYSANVMVYRKADVEIVVDESDAKGIVDGIGAVRNGEGTAGQCIWLARVRPEDCEGIVRFTVLQGKVVKPERQLRGGFDRGKGLVSW